MKAYQIEFQTPITEGVNELNDYLHRRINRIEKDFSMVENCEVELHQESGSLKNCEVAVWVTVPRHKYVAREKAETFRDAAEVAFDELYNQLNGKKYG